MNQTSFENLEEVTLTSFDDFSAAFPATSFQIIGTFSRFSIKFDD